ncbi:MAG: response regulator [Planctomycetota bacterium]
MAKKVLLIDDDKNAVKYLSVVLEENGYETYAAYDGREGLQKIQELNPDLIVLDVMMPKKSGFTLFKQLRRDEQYKNLPVLMLTGVAGVLEELDEESADTSARPFDSLREALRRTIREMRSEGLIKPEMFMDKPIDSAAFLARIQAMIGG